MSIKIDLSKHNEKFTTTCFQIEKKVNFIFGKNGTGKTTLANEIESQLSDDYNVLVFRDFDGVIDENDRLKAIALGVDNASIQKEINKIDSEVNTIKTQIEQPKEKNISNLHIQVKKAKESYDACLKKIDDFYSKSAAKIKNLSNPRIATINYNKKDFEIEIAKAALLPDFEVDKYRRSVNEEKKKDVNNQTYSAINLTLFLESTNRILDSSVKQLKSIHELDGDTNRQAFARQGMSIHENKPGEVCSFCGNEISNERWGLLTDYFNDEVKKLEEKINLGIKKIEIEISNIDSIKEMDENAFYDRFSQEIKNLNSQILSKRIDFREFLLKLKSSLEEKKRNLFSKTDILQISIPDNFQKIQDTCNELVKKNNDLSQNLSLEREVAKNHLRYHEIKMELDNFNYYNETIELEVLKKTKDETQYRMNSIMIELNRKIEERKQLILLTKNESLIAEQINTLLNKMGTISFSLELVIDSDENQKGQYQIKGYNNNLRPITELSKGEKNVIAFLYFMFSLKQITDNNKPKVIVLDDPMTSNDDTMQYLMMGEIFKYYNGINDDSYFILLTHNCHFYLNVIDFDDKKYKKHSHFHLLSSGEKATIHIIENKENDFKTNYEMLWNELIFLYESNSPPSLMISCCRRICETYYKFMCISSRKFYGDNVSAKKLFDVNMHAIDDLESEQIGKTCDDIKSIFKSLFIQNKAEDHFNNYWIEEKG